MKNLGALEKKRGKISIQKVKYLTGKMRKKKR